MELLTGKDQRLLNQFFCSAAEDNRIGMADICVYAVLYQYWSENFFRNPVQIKRRQIMRLAKINAKTTYHKCIKNLQEAGYIKYHPSFHPQGSIVYLLKI